MIMVIVVIMVVAVDVVRYGHHVMTVAEKTTKIYRLTFNTGIAVDT
jgi:hypothetical protein